MLNPLFIPGYNLTNQVEAPIFDQSALNSPTLGGSMGGQIGGIGGAAGLVPKMKRAQLQAELDRATKEMRRLRPMRDKALRDAANQQAIQMPQMNRNWAIGAALLGGLAEAIQPGAGAQGLAGFTQGAQQRMQQEFQNRQLLDESNRRRLGAEAQIAGLNLEDAQLDYNVADRELDQLSKAEQAAAQLRESMELKRASLANTQANTQSLIQNRLNDKWARILDPITKNQKLSLPQFRQIISQAEAFASKHPEMAEDLKLLTLQLEDLEGGIKSNEKRSFLEDLRKRVKSGAVTEKEEQEIRSIYRARGLEDADMDISPDDLGVPIERRLKEATLALAQSNQQLKAIELRYAAPLKQQQLDKGRAALAQSASDLVASGLKIEKLRKELSGVGASGGLTENAQFDKIEAAYAAKRKADGEAAKYDALSREMQDRAAKAKQPEEVARLKKLAEDYSALSKGAAAQSKVIAEAIPNIQQRADAIKASRSAGALPPTGVTEASARAEAIKAIREGKDKNAINARLQQWGYAPIP